MDQKKAQSDIKYEIINELGKIPSSTNKHLELNRISWNGNVPKYDIRRWSANRDVLGRGITLNEEELIALYELLKPEINFLKNSD